MNTTTVTEITDTSCRITWNHGISTEIIHRKLFVYLDIGQSTPIEIGNIPIEGTQLISGLIPNSNYVARINTQPLNGLGWDDNVPFKTLPLMKVENEVTPKVTASIKPNNSSKYWLIGLVSAFCVGGFFIWKIRQKD